MRVHSFRLPPANCNPQLLVIIRKKLTNLLLIVLDWTTSKRNFNGTTNTTNRLKKSTQIIEINQSSLLYLQRIQTMFNIKKNFKKLFNKVFRHYEVSGSSSEHIEPSARPVTLKAQRETCPLRSKQNQKQRELLFFSLTCTQHNTTQLPWIVSIDERLR